MVVGEISVRYPSREPRKCVIAITHYIELEDRAGTVKSELRGRRMSITPSGMKSDHFHFICG